jgi:O-antigen ligase
MLLVASKPVSQWLGIGTARTMEEGMEGNPLERAIFTSLLAIGIIVLSGRGGRVLTVLRMNVPILLFIGYCAVSTIWSDYPDVAFKRWIKGLGDLVMVTIVLTDAEQSAAIKRFLARAGFLLVPFSVLLIRYFPALGRAYKPQEGTQVFTGVTNDKNMLGVICLLFGLGVVWRILQTLRQHKRARNRRSLIAQTVLLAMVLWLFSYANSMTSLACFVLASGVMVATSFPRLARKPLAAHLAVATVVMVAAVALFFDAGSGMVKALGRDPSLTGRTELWKDVLVLNPNPLFGAGFESFWLGSRLDKLWTKYWWHPNEAHNGYLEVYLNLGWMGLALLAVVIVTGYRNVIRFLRRDPGIGRLRLAYFVVGVTYSFTEAGFRLLNPVWICFLMAAIAIPRSVSKSSSVRESIAEVPQPRLEIHSPAEGRDTDQFTAGLVDSTSGSMLRERRFEKTEVN